VVDADGPVEQVAGRIERIVLAHLARRTADRLGIAG
jgi:hypothetical protein